MLRKIKARRSQFTIWPCEFFNPVVVINKCKQVAFFLEF